MLTELACFLSILLFSLVASGESVLVKLKGGGRGPHSSSKAVLVALNNEDLASTSDNLDVVKRWGHAEPPVGRQAREEAELTLITFLQQAIKKYGEKKVAKSVYELAQNSLYDLVWLLAGDLDPWVIYDLYKVYNAANSDPAVLSVYERFRAGMVNRSIVPEVFAIDRRYDEFAWYRRVRGRLLENTDKYIGGTLVITNPPPKIEFGPDGKPIIEGKPETEVEAEVQASTTRTTTVGTTTTTTATTEDPELGDLLDVDLEDLLTSLLEEDDAEEE